MEYGDQWGGGKEVVPGVALFSWGPGGTIVVVEAPVETEQPANASSRGGEDAPRMPAAGTEMYEYRLHSPGCLWRHRRYVQRPFQLFFAEAQNEWSGCIRRTLQIGMGDSYVVQRRAMLADETKQYKVRPAPECQQRCIVFHVRARIRASRRWPWLRR